jgi:hypothetical protein
MTPDMFSYDGELRRKGVLLYFNGPMSQTMVEGMAGIMRQKLRAEAAALPVSQRIFAILVEQMQNIVRYSVERVRHAEDGAVAHGQVIVGREDDGSFFVACGNRIRSCDGDGLTRRIEHIRSLGGEDLKAYYRQTRRGEAPHDSQGAGLGLIEMARHSARPLDYRITPLDRDTAFFAMKVVA